MKVLHVIPAVGMSYGGPSLAIKSMTQAAYAQGLQIDVATTTANGHHPPLSEPIGIRCEKENIGYYFFNSHIGEWKFSWRLARWLYQHIPEYDLVHIHAIFCFPNGVACRIAQHKKIPYILRPAGILDPWCLQQNRSKKKLYYQLIEQKNLQNAAAIHVTSADEARSIQALGVEKNICIIPHAVLGIEYFERQPPSASHPLRLLFLSRLHHKKGIETLLLAFAQLIKSQPQARLTIAGEAETAAYTQQLNDQVQALRLGHHVEFVGFVDGAQKKHILQTHHVFVLPSFCENFSLATAEALVSGMPVILSDQVGLAEKVTKFVAGRVVSVNAVQELVSALQDLSEASTWLACRRNATRLADEYFTLERLGASLVKMYEQIKMPAL